MHSARTLMRFGSAASKTIAFSCGVGTKHEQLSEQRFRRPHEHQLIQKLLSGGEVHNRNEGPVCTSGLAIRNTNTSSVSQLLIALPSGSAM
jgi:hypothetical protein